MQPPIHPQLSNINLAIWYFKVIVMHNIYQSHGHASTMKGTITWSYYQPTRKKLQTSRHQKMSQSTQNVEYSNMWCRPRPKQKSGDCSTMGIHWYPYASHSTNSVLPNCQPQQRQTTPQPKTSSPLQLDKNVPSQWKYDCIGWWTG